MVMQNIKCLTVPLLKHIPVCPTTKGKLVFLCFSIFFVAATSEGGAGGRHIPDQWDSVAVAALVLYINVPALLVYSNVAALVLSSNPTVVNSAGL